MNPIEVRVQLAADTRCGSGETNDAEQIAKTISNKTGLFIGYSLCGNLLEHKKKYN
ncbi:MAG: hypothetical protein LC730_04815 [Acidobacteria bacterium]|nr:hypothetical protein [Acidobacteriota bacterium]